MMSSKNYLHSCCLYKFRLIFNVESLVDINAWPYSSCIQDLASKIEGTNLCSIIQNEYSMILFTKESQRNEIYQCKTEVWYFTVPFPANVRGIY